MVILQFCCYTFHVFYREELPKLIRRLNHEKNAIKESGVSVDGKDYKIKFVGKGWTDLYDIQKICNLLSTMHVLN